MTYQNPEEKCYFKSILEENKMYQEEDDLRVIEPKVIIRWCYNQFAFYSYMFLSNFMS